MRTHQGVSLGLSFFVEKIALFHGGFSGASREFDLVLRLTIMPFSSGMPLWQDDWDGQEEETAVRCDQSGEGGFASEHRGGAGDEAGSDEERAWSEAQTHTGEVTRRGRFSPLNVRPSGWKRPSLLFEDSSTRLQFPKDVAQGRVCSQEIWG
jgi:hypothetical protein